MVQKYTAPVRVFKYPFELVMAAYERRFPTCHLIPVFVGSDKIYEDISEDGAIHIVERRCQIRVDAPYLLRKITGVDHVLFIQKNTLDRRKRVLKIEAKNESFSNHININELCFYRVSPENENWTIFEQQASLEIKSFWGFEHVVEKLAVKHYSQNIKKGQEIIEYHINELAEEGITYIPPFKPIGSNQNLSNIESTSQDENSIDNVECNSDNHNKKRSIWHNNSGNEQSSNKSQNGLIRKDDSNKNSTDTDKIHRSNFRSNSMEEKYQATKQMILNKCESLKKKTNSLENNGVKSSSATVNDSLSS